MANTAPTPKAVALVLVPALVLMLAFAFFYVGAFHEPTPHHVPLAVVGPPAVAAKLSRLPGDPLDARQATSRADALSQIDDRKSTAPTRPPRTAYSSRRPLTERPLSRWNGRSTVSPLRSAGRRSMSPTSSRYRLRTPTAPQRSTR
jgi:hypothetical protein